MTNKKWPVGLRTFKTGIAVFLCILIFHFTNRDTPMIACLSAVFAMRQDTSSSLSFGYSRISGNLLGGAFGILYYFLAKQVANQFALELLVIPILVIILITLCNVLNLNTGIIGAAATLFIIVMTIPANESILFVLDRILDTVLGTIIAIAVNHFILPYTEDTEESNDELSSEQLIKNYELEINNLKKNIQEKTME